MDTHTAMQTYVRVVELGSFAAAADKMGQARSVVTRQIAFLEEKYGVRLLNRTTRRLELTGCQGDVVDDGSGRRVRVRHGYSLAGLTALIADN